VVVPLKYYEIKQHFVAVPLKYYEIKQHFVAVPLKYYEIKQILALLTLEIKPVHLFPTKTSNSPRNNVN